MPNVDYVSVKNGFRHDLESKGAPAERKEPPSTALKPAAAYPIKAAGRHLRHFEGDEVRRTVNLIVVEMHAKDWVDIEPVWYPVKMR
jgi:hypothetical protein